MKVITEIETTLENLLAPITLALRAKKLPCDLLDHRIKTGDLAGVLSALDIATQDVGDDDFAKGAINMARCLVESLAVA